MAKSLIVVDDFFDRAHDLREAAMRLTYSDQQGACPGRNPLERMDLPGLVPHVSGIVGERRPKRRRTCFTAPAESVKAQPRGRIWLPEYRRHRHLARPGSAFEPGPLNGRAVACDLQRLGNGMGFWFRTWNGVRSLVQVNAFVTRVLRARRWSTVLATTLLFGLGIWLALRDFSAGAWIAFAAGVVSLLREAWPALKDLFGTPDMLVERDAAFVQALFLRVQPSDEEERDGFVVEHVPGHQHEAVLRSARVDRWLRGTSLLAVVDDRKRIDVEARLRMHPAAPEAMLRCQARKSYRSDPSRLFLNERKFGLSDGISPGRSSVRCHHVDYFHSVVTNEAVTRRLVSDDGLAHAAISGSDQFPVTREGTAEGDPWRLRTLSTSGMADHVGVSTLVVTRDRKLMLWNQSGKALHSRNLFAPTGSGSCDWQDVVERDGAVDLTATLVHAMQREFLEESFGGELPALALATRVLSYFRWIKRGGKPEFVGVTRADIDSHSLRPNPAEVNLRNREALMHDVPDLEALRSCLQALRAASGVSIPLWVNVVVLAEAIDEDPAGWGEFLRLPMRVAA